MDFVSVTAFAKLHGVSKTAAQKWQGRGLLTFRDGRVDVAASDRALCHAGLGRYADPATRDAQPATRPGNQRVADVAGLADELTAAAEQDEEMAPALIAFAQRLAEGHHVDKITAETIKENALAMIRLIEARKRAGEVIEVADAEGVLFDMFRQQRDAWLNFSSRIAPLLAAELDVSAEKVSEALTAHVHQQLTDLGEPGNPLREGQPALADGAEGLEAATEA